MLNAQISLAIKYFKTYENESNFFTIAKAVEGTYLQARLDSREAKRFGMDPFSLSISEHRFLRHGLDEEDYSDWLAWILKLMCVGSKNPIRLCEEIFLSEELFIEAIRENDQRHSPSLQIEREYCVEKGHEECSGRLDILIHCESERRLMHVEVKVVSAESADLEKNNGYADSIDDKYPEHHVHHVLLVTEHLKKSYLAGGKNHPFHAVTWRQITQRLRRISMRETTSSLVAGVSLFFCGIVEQKLLGISRDSLLQLQYLQEANLD